MEELDQNKIMQMKEEGFADYKFIKLQIELKTDIEILGKKGKVFIGFISDIILCNGTDDNSNCITMPARIIFVDENVSAIINKNAKYSGAKSILISDFEKIIPFD